VDRLITLTALRLRLEARATLASGGRLFGVLLALGALALVSAMSALGAFALVRLVARSEPSLLISALSGLATLVSLGYVLAPLLAGVAVTDSHDFSRLLPYPVPFTTLLLSSMAASFLQPTVLALVPPIVAVALGLGGGPGLLFALVALLLGLLLTVAAAQATGVALHALSRRRRLHDRLAFVGIAIGVLVSVTPILVLSRGGSSARRALVALLERDVFVLSPFAWSARAAVHGSRGELLPFLGFGALTAVAALAAFGVAVAVAHRLYRGELDVGEAPSRAARARIRLPGAMGALVEKDLRVAWRDPRSKAVTLSSVVGPLVLLLLLGQGSPSGVGPAQLVMVASIAGLGVVGSNALAFERHGLGLLLGFPLDRLALLSAKNLAVVVLRGPALAALSLAALVLAGPLVAAAIATIVLLTQVVASAADNFLQILFPVPVAAAGGNPNAPVSGTRGLGAVATALLAMSATLAVAAPFAFLAWLPHMLASPALFALTLPLALAGACAVYFMVTSLAARLLQRREPELLARLRGDE
jgi:ABC-2 type transport system permease protein